MTANHQVDGTDRSATGGTGPERLAESVSFDLLGPRLGADVRASIEDALDAGAEFAQPGPALAIFRAALSASIREIETHPRGLLLQRFLRVGPYEDGGEIPTELAAGRLSDEETAAAVRFVFSSMVNSFKGRLAELLACRPIVRLVAELEEGGRLPPDTRVLVGDVVLAPAERSSRLLQAADFHLLAGSGETSESGLFDLLGVAEVKSYAVSQRRMTRQIRRHLRRAARGLRVGSATAGSQDIRVGGAARERPVEISVNPARWRLPRRIVLETVDGRELLRPVLAEPPYPEDHVRAVGDGQWRITLRWSVEALASAAYEMTFWYMEKVGEVLYRDGVPDDWADMSPGDAGRNAVKMMLYYAILRARTRYEHERAVALYNTYGFGYALGMSFRDGRGRRQMLWPEDLREILDHGVSREGCRFSG